MGADNWLKAKSCGLMERLQHDGLITATREVPRTEVPAEVAGAALVLEHDRIPFISYSYEWPFLALKAAALLHLRIHKIALEFTFSLSDASSFNIQFNGPSPIFIDTSSFVPYAEGQYWSGYTQFCEQFLNPLLFSAKLGVAHNAIVRGSIAGLKTQDLDRLIPFPARLSPLVLFNVGLIARAERKIAARAKETPAAATARRRPLPKHALLMMLQGLERGIRALRPQSKASTWGSYADDNFYLMDEYQKKKQYIAEFVSKSRPKTVWDLGCNTGDYSKIALEAGAERVIGFDIDQQALESAFSRAQDARLNFLPLHMDLADPSPDQGWDGIECMGLQRRTPADALLVLALVHHLAIGRNIPLDSAVARIVRLAPAGVIEFVEKSDPTVQIMLAERDDIFDTYTLENFRAVLGRTATIVNEVRITAHGRTLFTYRTSP
jgi:ribosomal protein L11 methylase PrmA